MAGPSTRELNSTINTSHNDKKDREGSNQHQKFHTLVVFESRKTKFGGSSVEEYEKEDAEDDDRDQLKIYTGDHDVGADFGVALGLRVECYGCGTAAYGLDDEGDYVDGAEDPEVPDGSDGADSGAGDGDHAAEDDIDAGSEESGCYTDCQHGGRGVDDFGLLPIINVQICIRKAFAL
jgi:hypothetical protein